MKIDLTQFVRALYPVIGVIFLLVVIVIVIKIFAIKLPQKEEKKSKPLYNYKRKDFLISRPEHEFFDILVEIVGSQYYVFTQVHLPTILDYKITGQNWKGAFSHINQKSIDFVICDKAYIKPLLAIELDDKTHEREDRMERDGNVEQILKEAGMPLLRFKNNGSFDKEFIKNEVNKKLNI